MERIKARKTDKTAQEPEEVTATATDVTTTQPEPVATPEKVTTEYYGYLDKMDPVQKGRIKKQLDRRIYADGKICTWAEYIAEGYEAGQLKAYKDEYTYDKKGRDLAYHEHKVTEWVIWTAREMERGNGVLANKTIVDYALYLIKLMGTTAPEDTIPLDELVTAPDTAPQQPEEDTTTVPEEVATVETPVNETEEVTTEEATAPDTAPQPTEEDTTTVPATDDAILLRNLIDQYGNVGADYLDTLDYTQATKQEQRNVLFGRAKVTNKYYTTDKPDPAGHPQKYGLSRYYNRSGKRAVFIVYKDGSIIEHRLYEGNNNTYITEVRFNGGELLYKVTGGLVTRSQLIRDGNTIPVFFDDTNRPATPRDLPAPAPTRKTAKEAPATEENVPSKSRRQIIEEMRREQDGYPVKYWSLLAREIDNKTGGQLWNVPKFGTVIVTEKNIPWYFRYLNYLKTQPAREIEAIEDEARNLRAQLEKRIEAGRKGLYYAIETSNIAEEYTSLIIELHSAKARKDGDISEVEMYYIIGEQIRYAIEAFDKTGDRFPTITDMSIDFRNVTSTYNDIKPVYDANHPAPAPTPEPTGTPEEVTTEPTEESKPEQVTATAPQATEEVTTEDDTTTAPEATAETPVQEPEDVTTEESPEMTVEQEDDNAPVLRYFIERGGNACANYLDTLNYTQATERVYREKRGARTKVTERYYTKKDGTLYGLYRSYTRNGKRATFVVVKDRRLSERRTYGKNNNSYKADIQYNGVKIVYNVTDGLVTRAELTRDGKTTAIVFDDSNRPATPRDLPAPAPSKSTSKETAKEEPATTVQEQPTSKPAPTPEATTAPKEVQPVTTSKQEDGPAPYWLLLDNELRAQQEEQEQALATPEATKQEEPMHAPQMLKKIIEEKKKRASEGTNTTPLKTAVSMTTEVLTKKRAKELLGDDSSDYNTYILVDGKHVVRFDRPELSNTLYIDDESKEYKEYQRGNISAVELWRNDAMRLHNPARDLDKVKRLPKFLEVIRDKNNVLDFSMYGGRYGDRRTTPDEVEIYKAAAIEASEAFTKRLDSYIRRYGKKIYVHSYWANR